MGVKVSFFNEKETAATPAEAPRLKLVMPKAAVRTEEGTTYVFVMQGDRVERRAVKVGTAQGDQIEVLSGLSAGDRVVVAGPDTLVDGARVKEQQ